MDQARRLSRNPKNFKTDICKVFFFSFSDRSFPLFWIDVTKILPRINKGEVVGN